MPAVETEQLVIEFSNQNTVSLSSSSSAAAAAAFGQPQNANIRSRINAIRDQCSSRRKFALIAFLLIICVLLVLQNTESVPGPNEIFETGTGSVEKKKTLPAETAASTATSTAARDFTIPTIDHSLCLDPDESENILPTTEPKRPCKCTDRKVPISGSHGDEWMQFHDRMVQYAVSSSSSSSSSDNLDVVFLGDSIMEQWNGTKRLGQIRAPDMRYLFESFFTKTGGGSLEGIVLGSAMDTSPNLLWHLQNGLLLQRRPVHFSEVDDRYNTATTTTPTPPQLVLNPKVWFLLIGTNDLVGSRCSKQSTLQGILHIAQYIHRHCPNAKILIHGLLPRGQGGREALVLGNHWQHIQWINQQLKQGACTRQRNQNDDDDDDDDDFVDDDDDDDDAVEGDCYYYYMDSGEIFLNQKQTELNSRLIADGIHPRLSGMKLWGPLIVKAIEELQ